MEVVRKMDLMIGVKIHPKISIEHIIVSNLNSEEFEGDATEIEVPYQCK